jgi:hypothetical protein
MTICKTCKYWKEVRDNKLCCSCSSIGQCVLNPIVVIKNSLETCSHYTMKQINEVI